MIVATYPVAKTLNITTNGGASVSISRTPKEALIINHGAKGDTGLQGIQGISAYQIWLALGNTGTEIDFIASLVGDTGLQGLQGIDGISAYQVWLSLGNVGTEAEFISSLNGTNGIDGTDGKSAYELAVIGGYGDTEANWLLSLVGADGTNGTNGLDGQSAYELAVIGGFVGTEADWLLSLVGADGFDGVQLNVANTWTAMQRAGSTVNSTLSIDLTNDTNLIVCTPTIDGTLTFINMLDNTSGRIILINPLAHIISLGAMVKAVDGTATDLSVAGTYLLSFDCYGGNVYVSRSGAMV